MRTNPTYMSFVRRALVVAGVLLATLWTTQSQVSTQGTLTLPFAKHFLIPGNYVVGTVDLLPTSQSMGQQTGIIPISGVPVNGEVIAAYLYWETISQNVTQNAGVKFRGQNVEAVKKTSQLLNPTLFKSPER